MTDTEELATAIEAVRLYTPMDDPWTGYDISGNDQHANTVEHAIATILNAVWMLAEEYLRVRDRIAPT